MFGQITLLLSRCSLIRVSWTESSLDGPPAAAPRVSAREPGAAQAAGGQARAPREAAEGRRAGRGELREEEIPATNAGGAPGESSAERTADGGLRFCWAGVTVEQATV